MYLILAGYQSNKVLKLVHKSIYTKQLPEHLDIKVKKTTRELRKSDERPLEQDK